MRLRRLTPRGRPLRRLTPHRPRLRRVTPHRPRLPRLDWHVRPWREWTLRTRLVASMCVLAAIALIVANAAGILLLRSYLVERVDQQLTSVAGIAGDRTGGGPNHPVQPPGGSSARPVRGIGPDYRFYHFDASGDLIPFFGDGGAVITPSRQDGPDLGSIGDIKAHSTTHRPYTVEGSDGTPWRVVATADPVGGGTVVVAISMKDVTNTTNKVLVIDVTVAILLLVMVGAVASSVVRIGLRPLTRMGDTAAEISEAEDLSIRVADTDPHTESGRLGQALNAMLHRVEAAMDARRASEQRLRQFLADASHELRTPLTSIQGFAELYRRGGTPPGPALDEAMGRIESEVVRMRVLVNDLLMLARLDEERPMKRQPVDLLEVAAETVRDAHVRVPTRFVQLAALDDAFATFEPVTVLGDDDRLRQVALNLVSNALQHTGENTRIVVRVGRPRPDAPARQPSAVVGKQLDPATPVAVLEVSDTGAGMTDDVAQHVFERLYRAERSRDRRHGGAGLGLAIVAGIVQAHGGRVELFTGPHAGSRFRVILPAMPGEEMDDETTAPFDDSEELPSLPEVPVEQARS